MLFGDAFPDLQDMQRENSQQHTQKPCGGDEEYDRQQPRSLKFRAVEAQEARDGRDRQEQNGENTV